jgi:uncharacterized OsmC-like protein
MTKVVVKKSDVEGFYTGTAGEFSIQIERTQNRSPRSIDLVLLGLGSCTIATIAHYLRRKGLPADAVDVELSAEFDEQSGAYRDFTVMLHFSEGISADTRKVVAAIAKTCRIHRTLESAPRISVEIAEPAAAA